ncbi:MAG TPA: rhamnulokinase [Candidatus Avimonoglobus intestinipullorum]|uniref:Rhamnulokinase n=1 Tax=Candidatus Avimonoglobus intestinipullorum TaxID=2840699 RepID=A0A9D1LWJ6_9FIRM|nr:rhamnulokinase [Candidatus Avimonoglobus intestinipullorum]
MGKIYKFLAFDFGASSGRAMLAKFDGEKITLEEKHRFSNDPVTVNGGMYWDILRLFHEIKQGILKCANSGDRDIDCIGIDTWGVDYGLLDEHDQLLGNPYHYRDTRTDGMYEEAFARVPKEEIFQSTGIAFNWFNTLYQLLAARLSGDVALKNAKTLLFIPDLLNFFLTGEKRTEYTIASTSQMFDSQTHTWAEGLLKKLDIPTDIFADMVYPGEQVGVLKADLAEELGVAQIPVIAVASHDTGSAVASVPVVDQDDFIYISSGTWSLMGVELDAPNVSAGALEHNFTNEGGVNRTIRFLKNIMGLWLVQESRRQWDREGELLSFDELEQQANAAEPFASLIDPDYPAFQTPGNMPRRIREFCEKTGQKVPQTKGEVVRCIAESLAFKYRNTIEGMEEVTGKKYNAVNIVGGGIKDKMICRFTANATKRTVQAGPVEATSIGNVIVQAMAVGAVRDLKEGRRIVRDSFDIAVYEPEDAAAWDAAYEKWKKIIQSI